MNAVVDFTALNNFFDHIYVVTLERAVDRQQRITELLEGLKFEFFTGADKKDFTIDALVEAGIYDEQKAISLHRYNKPMNTGQIGCSWSHRLVYEDIIKKGYQKVLILEDDVVPQKEGFTNLTETLGELPADWELLYLDYHKNIHRNFGSFLKVMFYHFTRIVNKIKWSSTTINNLYTKKFSERLRCAGFHDFTSAYAITESAAKQLLQLQTPLAFVADNLLAHACTNKLIRGFIAIPKVFTQVSQSEDKNVRTSYVEEVSPVKVTD